MIVGRVCKPKKSDLSAFSRRFYWFHERGGIPKWSNSWGGDPGVGRQKDEGVGGWMDTGIQKGGKNRGPENAIRGEF